MELNYSLQSTLDIVFLIQGISFGILLIVLNKKQQRNTFFLGVFVLLFGLTSVTGIAEGLNLIQYYPYLNHLPFDFLWLLFPVFYLYVKEISIFPDKKNYYILIPGIIEFLFLGSLLFLEEETRNNISDSLLYGLFFIFGGIIFSIVILVKTFVLIKRHTKSIKEQYSSIEYKEVAWIKYFSLILLFYFLSTFITIIVVVILGEQKSHLESVEIIFTVINCGLIFWASFKGITQQNVSLLIPEDKIAITDKNSKDKVSKKDALEDNDESIKIIIEKLKHIIDENQLFKNVDLTIIDVSEKIGIHPRKLSTIINSNLGSNFNTFINNYRVALAKELLRNNDENNLTIEGIAYEAGFKSKSSFYTAFKNATQMTPVNYKNSITLEVEAF